MNNIQQNTIKTIDHHTLKELWIQDQVILIDVREAVEYKGEHIEGAILNSLSKFTPDLIPNNSEKPVILYCQSSNRSAQAAQKLLNLGSENVTHLEGGLNLWKQAGYPTKINKKAPISIMRQVQIIAGSLVLLGIILNFVFNNPYFLILSGFVGAGLTFAGVTGICAMANLLMKLPYNKV